MRGGLVTGDDHVVEVPQGMVRFERLLGEHVDRRPGYSLFLQGSQQCPLVDNTAPGKVDEIAIRLHRSEDRVINDVVRVRRVGREDDEVVEIRKNFDELGSVVNAIETRDVPRPRTEADYGHVEGFETRA